MKSNKIFILILIFISFTYRTFGQKASFDSIPASNNLKFKYSSLVIPSLLIGYGIIGIESDGLKIWNSEIKEELNENIDEKLTVDDFSQYVPALSVYGLNAFGIKGRHNFRDRTTILATSYLIMATAATGLKLTTNIKRPDSSTNNSFPSGHTATAFMGAEFLWQEYRDISVWYGISGYIIATGTGFFRMYNDRHWITDVAAGAGIGILSTKIAYWVNPYITKKIFCDMNMQSTSILYPYYNGKQIGLGLAIRL